MWLPLLLIGCGDISNAWILEDVEFLDALPDEARHTVALDAGEGAKDLGDRPSLLTLSYNTSTTVNGLILDVLALVDEVRTYRPTTRTESGRVWGPYPYTEDIDSTFWIERTGGGRFDWGGVASSATTDATWITGTHWAGATVVQGDGAFTWTIDDVAEMLGSPARGTIEVDYDNRDGIDLLVTITGWTDGAAAPASADYAFRLVDGEGDFQYATVADLDDDGLFEDFAVRTRWIAGVGGRSDAVVSGGSLDTLVEGLTQCWDAGYGLTYEADEYGWVETVGVESDCVYEGFAEVDRI